MTLMPVAGMVRRCVEAENVRVVMLDSLSGYQNAMPAEQLLPLFSPVAPTEPHGPAKASSSRRLMRCCFRVRRIATLVIGGVSSGYWYIGRPPYLHCRDATKPTLRGARPSVPESLLDARKTHERNVSSFVHWLSLWVRALLGTGDGQHSCQPNNNEVRGPADDGAARLQLSAVLLEVGSESVPNLPMTAAGHAALNDELADRVRIKRRILPSAFSKRLPTNPTSLRIRNIRLR